MISIPVRTPGDIGALIRERRRELGLDQAELAAKVGATRLWIGQIEKGKPGASLGLVLRTLAALGVVLATRPESAGAVPDGPDIDAIIDAARRPARP
jgi:HTH-type transcriptional regulator / antitoxin HipB